MQLENITQEYYHINNEIHPTELYLALITINIAKALMLHYVTFLLKLSLLLGFPHLFIHRPNGFGNPKIKTALHKVNDKPYRVSSMI